LDGFGEVLYADVFAFGNVCNGAGHFENTFVCPSGETKALDGSFL
jgi:hypothetical protein